MFKFSTRTKTYTCIAILLVLLLISFGCQGGDKPGSSGEKTAGESSSPGVVQGEVKGLEGPIAEGPTLITSAGQSPDADIVAVMAERSEIAYTFEKTAFETSLGENRTLIVVIGGSAKGLGEAGLKAEQEVERSVKLVEAAQKEGLCVIGIHSGGEARRGDLTDHFIREVAPKVDYLLVLAEGNKDDIFTKVAQENGIPLDQIDGLADVGTKLKEAYK